MTAHRPSMAAVLNPAHATMRNNACIVTGGVLEEMTPDERRDFIAEIERLANGHILAIHIDGPEIAPAGPETSESRVGGATNVGVAR